MPTLAATLKTEIRRIVGRELRRAFRPVRRLAGNVKRLRLSARDQKRAVAALERRVARLKSSGGGRGRRPADGPQIAPSAILALRHRLGMTRLQFAELLRVSPGSIFGWEKGRTVPRGASRARLVALRSRAMKPKAAARGSRGRK